MSYALFLFSNSSITLFGEMAEVEHLQDVAILFVLVFSYSYFCGFGGGGVFEERGILPCMPGSLYIIWTVP
jgi:hypothetical protein